MTSVGFGDSMKTTLYEDRYNVPGTDVNEVNCEITEGKA